MSQVKASAKSLRIAPRKLGLVAGLVRGRTVNDSLAILEHTPKGGAPLLAKVVKSAAANAETNQKLSKDQLLVSSILVSPGSIIKRYRPGARGMIRPIMKRTSHVTVVVEATPAKPAARAAAKAPAAIKTMKETDGSKS